MKLTFHGGAGSVTGANYLLESGGYKILVDCGLQQGTHLAEKQNFEPFAYAAAEVKAVFITHAHLDHTGRLPKLYREGFRGEIYSTPPTRDLAELILLDSEKILAQESAREKCEPFCTVDTVNELMERWRPVRYHHPIEVGPFKVELYDAGHVLGSAIIRVQTEGKTVIFSGDLGNYPAPIIQPTEIIAAADYCLVESTYGDRVHADSGSRRQDLKRAVEETATRGGTLMIPAFALERTQDLLLDFNELIEHQGLLRAPVYIDSPLAIKMTAIYKKYENYFNQETVSHIRRGDDIFNFPGLHMTLTSVQSKEINNVPPPKIIMAGSGMSHGGRILHHERRYLSDPKNGIVFVGYQAVGSLGRQIMDGAKAVHIFGEEVAVRCQRFTIAAYSAHADQPKLLEWVGHMRGLRQVFTIQGEGEASETLARLISEKFKVPARPPQPGETVEL